MGKPIYYALFERATTQRQISRDILDKQEKWKKIEQKKSAESEGGRWNFGPPWKFFCVRPRAISIDFGQSLFQVFDEVVCILESNAAENKAFRITTSKW